jgi:hypothetical protein
MVCRPYANDSRLDRSWTTRRFSPALPLPQPVAVYAEHLAHAHDDDAADIPDAIAVINVIIVSAAKP